MAEDPGTPSAGAHAPGAQWALQPGTRVAGYVIEEQVGAGGMAVVYRARDDVLGRLVAVKVLSPALASDEEFRARFLRESRAVAAVDEPHIVPVYGAGDAGGVLYIATRFVAGGDLSRLQRAAGGPLPPTRAADLISQVASALDAAHAAGLVHRDVKPGNILVETVPGRPEHAYLSDFGLSKSTSAGATGLTATGRFMGTPDFCAPEQIAGGAIDGRADQYSLACVAFSLLAGVVPFNRGDDLARMFAHVNSPVPAVTSLRPELPPAVNDVLARGMAKNPAGRFDSCAAFAWALRGALGIGAGASLGAAPGQGPGLPGPLGYQQTVGYQPTPGYQQTATVGGWQHPSLPPGSAGWQGPGWQGQPAPPGQVGSLPPRNAGAGVMGGGTWPLGPGQAPPGPGYGQRPPRKHTGLIVGGSVAASVVLVVGVIAGVTLSGNGGGKPGPVPTRATTSAPGPATASSGPPRTGTATVVGSVSAPAPLSNAFFSGDGKYIVGRGPGTTAYVWSTSTFKLVAAPSVGGSGNVTPISFSPDDSTLYVFDSANDHLDSLDVATGKLARSFALPSNASLGYTYAFDGSVVDALFGDGTVKEYEMATGKLLATVKNPGSAGIGTVRSDGTGRYALFSDVNGTAYLVDTQSQQTIGTFKYSYSSSNSGPVPELTRDGKTAYIPGGSTAPARIWSTATRSYITPDDTLWPTPDNGVIFSTDGKFDLTSPTSVSETVDFWNIATRAHVITVTVPGGANEDVLGIGPGASELLSTSGLDPNTSTFKKMNVFAIPG